MQRSAISIPSNIAEGAERPSTPDFIRFLGYGKASCGELRTQLLIHREICRELDLSPMPQLQEMIDESTELSKMINGLMKKITA